MTKIKLEPYDCNLKRCERIEESTPRKDISLDENEYNNLKTEIILPKDEIDMNIYTDDIINEPPVTEICFVDQIKKELKTENLEYLENEQTSSRRLHNDDVEELCQVPNTEGFNEFNCDFCDYISMDKSTLEEHIDNLHLKIEDFFECSNSDDGRTKKGVKLKPNLDDTYLGLNSVDKNHKCQSCGFSTNSEGNLRSHIKTIHMGIKKYKCEQCNYRTTTNRNLKHHVTTIHLGIKNHQCKICDHRTTTKGNLKQHINTVHVAMKNHNCQECDYCTTTAGNLKKHVNIVHMGIRHKCQYCDYISTKKGRVREHIEGIHKGIRKHKCHLCSYDATRKADLKQHIDGVHMKTKNFTCRFCEYTTNRKADLVLHVGSIHLELKSHKCELCNYTANRKNTLKQHVNNAHKRKKNSKLK